MELALGAQVLDVAEGYIETEEQMVETVFAGKLEQHAIDDVGEGSDIVEKN